MNAECTDTEGSYECECKTGYSGDGFNCSGKYRQDYITFVSYKTCIGKQGVCIELAQHEYQVVCFVYLSLIILYFDINDSI